MSLQKKLEEAEMRGFISGYKTGCNDTWDLINEASRHIPGIGDKTRDKLLNAIRVNAEKQMHSKVGARKPSHMNVLNGGRKAK